MNLAEFRTALWHLRKGGFKQLGRYLEHREHLRLHASEKEEDRLRVEAMKRVDLRGFDPLDFSDFPENFRRKRPFERYRVAAILDEFSHIAWGGEFSLVPIAPGTWTETLQANIDFLLVESAWHGNGDQWQYQIVGSQAPSTTLCDVIEYCNEHGIPTVFWNKEDPVHFNDFIETAKLFDVVATTDAQCVARYEALLPNSRVIVVPFAAQPRVHHPIRTDISARYDRGDICFAGTYFRHKFAERAEQMDMLLGAGLEAAENLHTALTIYSRNEDVDEKYRFPEPVNEWVVGALPYSKMLGAYRGYKVFLNVNTVSDSPTMFSRRVVELVASGTAVVSTPALGIRAMFSSEEVPVVQEKEHAAALIESLVRSPQERDRMVLRAQRVVWEGHTYTHRARQVLDALGLDSHNDLTERPFVSVILATMRPGQLDHALQQMRNQHAVDVEILIGLHGFSAEQQQYPGVTFVEFGSEVTLGEVLNGLISKARGDYVAKIDDDDCYGPNYLRDQVNALRYSGADLVGKQASYLFLESENELILRKPWREHTWTDLVAGPTLVGSRQVFEKHPFHCVNRGEDTKFLADVIEAGGTIYSADRFNFVQVRSSTGHTWDVNPANLKRNGVVETYGLHLEHVYVD